MSLDMRTLGVLILAMSVFVLAMTEIAKRFYAAKLAALYERGEMGEYLHTLEMPLVRLVLPAWNRAFMRMNALMVEEDRSALDKLIPEMLCMGQSPKQRRELIGRAFNYYVEQGNEVGAKPLLEEIERVEPSEVSKQARMTYEIYLEKSFAYIDAMETRLSEVSGVNRGFTELLLAIQYENKGDARRAEQYFEKSCREIEGAVASPSPEEVLSGE
ncbi:hypothetical protein GT516_08440 [Collinsella sp. BIOML-A4]|uniref:hypothetical protein n=1 Tax=unclassified Collinsella TaxID=2637548 RepID=UPI00136C4798|nr:MULTISPECIES: hypothetical protein [unclassified Collinsella]MZJ33730.1 hypothetical protein [Collinsella sp. BIOML-A1]MZJ28030.1 hypothetical protein [Collinsella sp. BIOML-A2]MZJ28694.1 hypothetical protein [Collinsella sp. BIOML-A3]MZJ97473.1 hypothetical protein [Collinsella sp. BIOML-A6]MZK31327.1 hypothetical protein [Collinsella sp. BIOML-A5]